VYWPVVYRHTNDINMGLYMQPQMHTACTRDYDVEQILLQAQLNNILIF